MRSILILSTFLAASLFAADAFAQDCDGTPSGETDPANTCRLCDSGAWRFLPEHTVCEPSAVRCENGAMGEGIYRNQCVPAGETTVCEGVFKTSCPNGHVCAEDGTCATTCEISSDCIDGYECVSNACQRSIVTMPDAGAPDAGLPDAGSPDGGGADPDASSPDTGGTTPGDTDGNAEADTGSAGGGGDDGCSSAGSGTPGGGSVIALLALGLVSMRRRKCKG